MRDDLDRIVMDRDESAAVMKGVKPWEHPTAEQVRNCVMEHRILVTADDEDDDDARFFQSIVPAIADAVQAGRMFDLGHLPNGILTAESTRAIPLILHGHIGHPFRDPYVLFHTWSDPVLNGGMTVGALYFVDPMDFHAASNGVLPAGTFLTVECEAIMLQGRPWMLMKDAAMVAIAANEQAGGKPQYFGDVRRSAIQKSLREPHTTTQIMCNIIDPVTACLLLLATDGVAVDRMEPSPKLNKARAKNGKPAIPAHWRVRTGPYVTALTQRGQRRSEEGRGGHHATPVPHLRRGHVRHLNERHGGGTTWVRAALVNLKDPDAPLSRSFYSMQQETQP